MNRRERRAVMSRDRQTHDRQVKAAIEAKVNAAIEKADLILYTNPSLPGVRIHVERPLMEKYGMDFAGALMLQAENNRKQVSRRGLDPKTFAMTEGLGNQWRGQRAPDLHYLWFRGETYVTTKELVPYGMS